MKVAVTGSTGFIGRHVLTELARHPVEVIAIERGSREGVPVPSQVEFVQLDLQDVSPSSFTQIGSPDVLIHLAWGGLSNYHSLHHFEKELPVQYRFLQSLIKSGLQSLVVTGTCFEYGMQCGPLGEAMETHPDTPYGFAKDVLHRQLQFLKRNNSFHLTWGRLFYLYGEHQAARSLLSQLKSAVERGDKVFNMSGGEQLRDYLPVEDVAKYLVSLALWGEGLGIVNICSGKPVSIRKLVEDWIEENNWRIKLNLGCYPYPDYEPMAFWGDRRKLDAHWVSS